MSHISRPVDWEVFSIPSVQPVQYYSILKKKREFSHLMKQYDAQIFKQGYLHYCRIVPKSTSSSLNSRYEIIIVFFDETPSTSFIGFRVKVSKETFMHESNSLLLFLKKTEKADFYFMKNNFIHVQCGTNAWELFYLLYGDYLRRYVLTIIGTRFFYYFVYSCCIQKEIQLLEILYKGSKVIRVSKSSIYYEIHRKRKISVTDLIHMTVNMPKSKRYIISCFSSKESILCSDLKAGDYYTTAGSKINVSKLMLKKFKKQNALVDDMVNNIQKAPLSYSVFSPHSESQVIPEFNVYKSENHNEKASFSNAQFKRKIDEVENLYKDNIDLASKSFKTPELHSVKNKWEEYQNIKPYTIKHYSSIYSSNPSVNNILKNGNSTHFNSNSSLLKTESNAASVLSLSAHPSNKKYKINPTSATQNMPELRDGINSYKSSDPMFLKKDNRETSDVIERIKSKTSLEFEPCFDCVMPSVSSPNLPNIYSDIHGGKPHLPSSESADLQKHSDIKTSIFVPSNDTNQDSFNILCEDATFTTGAGKAINISNAAILKAHQLIENDFSDENKQILPETVTCNRYGDKIYSKTPSSKINYPGLRRKMVTRDASLPNISESKFSPCTTSISNSEMTLKTIETVLSTNIHGNLRSNNLDNMEDEFSTAAGKAINISDSSMEAAQKLIQDFSNEEKKPCSENVHLHKQTNKTYKNVDVFKDIGCTSKAIDIDMDKTLVDKFFEDTVFDEKELELIDDCNKNDTAVALKSNSHKNLPLRKPRKSLGGRRSMKFCSDKL